MAACSPEPVPPPAPVAPPPTTPSSAALPTVQLRAELLANSFGPGTVADLSLPEPFLRRVTDRVLRARYFEARRVIVPDGQAAPTLAPEAARSTPKLEIVPVRANPARSQFLPQLAESWPPARGYRALRNFEEPRPIVAGYLPDSAQVPAEWVAQQLSRDGLLLCTARVVAALRQAQQPITLEALGASGLPIDWLEHFEAPAKVGGPLLPWMEARLAASLSPEQLRPELDTCVFRFRPTRAGFQLTLDSGEEPLLGLRAQLSRGDPWFQVGDGGNVELLRALVRELPQVPLSAALPANQLERFQRTASTWEWPEGAALRLVLTDLPVSQWAQDNGKPGRDAQGPLFLVPRFASRSELGSVLVPSETYLVEEYAAAGLRVAVSPLSFQGGNLICVRVPASGERLLLMGEAELHRNTSLGLTRDQVLAAFRTEFGVERCVVLPAVGFHIDTELSVRRVGEQLVAFVNDMQAGAEGIVRAGLVALERGGRLDGAQRAALENLWEQRKLGEFLQALDPLLQRDAPAAGQFSEGLARLFSSGPGDHGPGNFLCFLAALDYITGIRGGGDNPELDPHTAAYLQSFLRRELDRLALIRGLEGLGMRIVPLPGFPEEAQGLAPLNMIHAAGLVLMPAHAGLYRSLDLDCQQRLERELGPGVRIVLLGSAESQRRGGSVRCSLSFEAR